MTTCAGRHPAASKFTDCQGRFSDKTIPPEVLEPVRRQRGVDAVLVIDRWPSQPWIAGCRGPTILFSCRRAKLRDRLRRKSIETSLAGRRSACNLRAGFVTSALEHGADLFKVMDVTRHRRVETLKGYDRRAKAFRDHAGEGFL
jgi:hypothetical protein